MGAFFFAQKGVVELSFLKINDVDLSSYINAMVITHEPVWSTNAGRTLDATFVGDIVARKWKLQITTKPLGQSDTGMILGLLESSPFFNASFIPTNGSDDSMVTAKVYTSTPTVTTYSYHPMLTRYKSIAFNLIEQ